MEETYEYDITNRCICPKIALSEDCEWSEVEIEYVYLNVSIL